MHGLKVEKKVL